MLLRLYASIYAMKVILNCYKMLSILFATKEMRCAQARTA